MVAMVEIHIVEMVEVAEGRAKDGDIEAQTEVVPPPPTAVVCPGKNGITPTVPRAGYICPGKQRKRRRECRTHHHLARQRARSERPVHVDDVCERRREDQVNACTKWDRRERA